MLCLSVRQPWAWLIVHGHKDVENRRWATQVRGPVLIHAAQTMWHGDYEDCVEFVRGFRADAAQMIPPILLLERGGIVGQATIVDCVETHGSDWFCGPFGFVLAEQRPLPFRPWRGALGFFEVGAAGPDWREVIDGLAARPVAASVGDPRREDEMQRRRERADAEIERKAG